jgi:hypothetical protein
LTASSNDFSVLQDPNEVPSSPGIPGSSDDEAIVTSSHHENIVGIVVDGFEEGEVAEAPFKQASPLLQQYFNSVCHRHLQFPFW